MEFKDRSLSDRRSLYYSQTVTATMNPTEYTTGSSGSSTSRNSSSSNSEPLLTTGERVGAVIFASISIVIAIYFLLLNVRIRRYRKKKQSEMMGRRRRRPTSVAEKEDKREEGQDSTLVVLGEVDVSSQNSHKSDMAIAEQKDDPKHASPMSISDDEDTEPDSCTYSLDEESTYPHRFQASNLRRSHSACDDSTRYTLGDSTKCTMDTRYTIDSSKYTADIRTEYTEDNRTEYTAEESVRSYSLTTAFLDAILPSKKRNKNRRRGGHNPQHREENYVGDLDSYYTRHEDEDDEANDGDSASANTINSPFHPSPPRSRTTPPRLSPNEKTSAKQRTYFLSNDDSCLCADIGNSGNVRPLDDGEDIFDGIPEEDEDRPFDCVVPTRRSKSTQSDKPFDCYGDTSAYHNLGNVM